MMVSELQGVEVVSPRKRSVGRNGFRNKWRSERKELRDGVKVTYGLVSLARRDFEKIDWYGRSYAHPTL